MNTVFGVLEMVGTVAFAVSGVMEGVHKDMDLFGVLMLGLVTAVGGGVIRDLMIGVTPPRVFQDPLCALIALGVGLLLFFALCLHRKKAQSRKHKSMEVLLFLADTLGLAAFTVLGILSVLQNNGARQPGVLLFVGVITGIGGGILRDVLAGTVPYVFRKHVYALASLAGAALTVLLLPYLGEETAALAGFGAVLLLRVLAALFHWNLPRVPPPAA